ncbi:regulatory protein GemA [Sphingomonas canadensis]|uniref:Regulatory protein GemA n=1 Tax=Sphingomonas canadensis TaxID=1219257 RepID=A0ABW3H4P4_9SPHN|nr:regulatory protein GemA [Sphingomonas canadensis]MCW3835998.1 regulatory protein GemA [Sphingomonas canadensis]
MTRMISGAAIFGKSRARADHMPGREAPAKPGASKHRKLMLAKIHIARSDLRLSSDDYQGILYDIAGATSAADCSDAQLGRVLDHFKARGWRPATPAGRGARPADHPAANKARALWISLHRLGEVRQPGDKALEAFARRQLGCERLQWANQSMMYRVIEALKDMAQRAGWDQNTAGLRPEAVPVVLRRRLVEAILGRLWAKGLVPAHWDIRRAAWEFAGMEIELMLATASELDVLAKALGDTLRQGGGA